MDKIIQFLKEVRVELAKVSWPTRNQTVLYTLVVIGISVFMAVFLGLMDFGYKFMIDKFLL
ncbi:MAG: preprotein translocase subunit SecE [Candidatus Yanofskybacteria bacterium RIFCSPLOWO2_02_FULL_43_10]|uniref:Protein translocase subunit SecE n=1 Tax=Candidatus Yanofskybacteria bacterium RIFCSPLOWO2_12_FULL_43_11b TaxID=1802710 RepID=A0A1F8H996_9BACT|nr:MAG: preprotein translocase subunit SecE [Candidatus Yanofskybacteria bacterium RIFCSPHIGHO2_01_FULL_43_32]OGN10573.1 MAG: preprotein translocase subunit SecE [Candidatus Yanofskybacteria bacterium RIFCSPHIGHO2_02_FULL_43_12]OGN17774.1 MAG: preprotein translocase subunit SecE [Candidatus Yanofskybacteria bacterium RIFCSPHIGHO2_12_FULL_43_11]OGN24518.1 MAG: preprotein translocase subunit SecE [Candidatus Yanofskybacteria bacterium RIFCSPLOWO2_01_FULL_43_46]OGN28408.1 MAG: preprotein transloca